MIRAPGAYFEPSDPPPRRIAEVRTDIAGFVGVAERGPLNVPVRIESWTQFATRFGEHSPDGFLAYAVKGFFANGGRRCWIVRAGAANPDASRASLLLVNRAGAAVFEVVARDHGPGSEALAVRVEAAGGGKFSLFVELGERVLEVWRDLETAPEAPFPARPRNRFAPAVVNGTELDGAEVGQPDEAERIELGSVWIEIRDIEVQGDRLPVGVRPARRTTRRRIVAQGDPPGTQRYVFGAKDPVGPSLRSGYLGSEVRAVPVLTGLTLEHLTGENLPPGQLWGLKALERVDEIAIVAIPDLLWPGEPPIRIPGRSFPRCHVVPTGASAPERLTPMADERRGLSRADMADGHRALLRHCAVLKDRFAVLDVPAGFDPDAAIAWAVELRSEAGQYGALYFPWVLAPDPLPGANVRKIPAAGHIAGMYARLDLSAGVQKPPANEVLEEVRGVERDTDGAVRGRLNDEGVNAIVPAPGRGIRAMGARTLVPPNAAELRQWRYIHVRRLLLMFEEAIEQSAQWVVFADNRPERWREIDRVVQTFLDEQWRRGRLEGATADDAYRVGCDDATNDAASVAAGQMICEIAVRPPLPAEFVYVRIGRRAGETGAVAFGGVADAR